MTPEQVKNLPVSFEQAIDILNAIAQRCAANKTTVIGPDWGFGTGTFEELGLGHTHFGLDTGEDADQQLMWFIDGLHGILVRNQGLSFVKDTSNEL